jgi:CheY-specific phosphatase CheX
MQIRAEEVIKLSNEIWSSMLGMELQPCERVDLAASGPALAASVEIIGDWRARVRLDCSARLARRAAARFMEADPAEVSPEEVRDALGELTNITAGSVKLLLPCASRLSVPGMDPDTLPPPGGCVGSLQSGFTCEGEPLLITIVQESECTRTSR